MSEQRQVPDPTFRSYYGRPVIKAPVWKQPDVPLYLFCGGAAGAASLLAEGAAVSDLPALRRSARVIAAAGAGVGTVALIHDLGRPDRFLNMLRVLRPTSPLSVGSWILAPFSALSGAALASEVSGLMPGLGRLSGLGAAALGPALATYTGALIANTAVPAWHEAHRELPFVFAGSGAAAAAGLAVASTPSAQSRPARRLLVAGAALELGGMEAARRRLGMLHEPYEQGRPGALLKAARACTLVGVAASTLGCRSRLLSVAGGTATAAGSLLTRFGVFQAGMASARDPKYTVVPQRERLEARAQHAG